MAPDPLPFFVYKVADRAAMALAETTGRFEGMPVDTNDGFIHFSTAEQVPETLAKHFAGEPDLVLFAVRAASLGDALRWEVSRGGALFPHLYAPLETASIVWSRPITVGVDGSCDLPDQVG